MILSNPASFVLFSTPQRHRFIARKIGRVLCYYFNLSRGEGKGKKETVMRISAYDSVFVSATPRKPSHGGHNQSPVRTPFLLQVSKGSRPRTTANRQVPSIRAALITNPDDFEVGRFVGSYGFMNVTRLCSLRAAFHSFFFLFFPSFL